ncbi:MAG: hypothetical protein JWO36_761 [Myxococcales bacterium]|nr:hypothetical protein [Myxococcales bacterium]
MTRRLPLLLGACLFISGLTTVAEAGHAHFSGGVHFGGGGGGRSWGGGVHVSGGGGWSGGGYHWSRPTWQPRGWSVGGHIYVGSTYYYPRPYYYYTPEYVPSYYGTTSYYPVAATAAPGYVLPVQPELPKLGIGLFAGGSAVQDVNGQSTNQSSDVGVLGRLRLSGGLLLEGELGKTTYDVANVSNVRVDRRLGGSLIYEIGVYNRLAPYVLAGLGVQQADVAGSYSTTQDFGEIGVGLRLALTPNLHIAFDVRAGSRSTVSDNQTMPVQGTVGRTVSPPTSASGQSEDYTRGRLSAILYF